MECPLSTLSSGDLLHETRYRLLKQLNIPMSQQEQRADWLASDAQCPDRTVLLHQITFPLSTPSDQEKTIQTITQDLTALAEHPGFLPIIDVFQERGAHYIVQLYPEGMSLASLLKQQGGTLPGCEVAEYGLQISTMLSLLAQSHTSSVNGFLSAETILISPDRHQTWLLYFPSFSSQAPQQEKAASDDQTAEQIHEKSSSPSPDLYSLATTLHSALTGYDPDEKQASVYPLVRHLNPAVTPQMEALLERVLHSSTSQRLTDPFQMQQELSNLIISYPAPYTTYTPYPLPIGKEQIHQHSYQKRRRNLAIAVGLGTAILLLLILTLYPLLTGNPSATAMTQQAAYQKALDQELNLELQAYSKYGIGLSDGRLVFDIYSGRTKAGIDLKQQAASALRQGNTRSTMNLLKQAIAADPADGEAQIYNENLHVLQSGAPYITIVIGLSIDNSPGDLVIDRPDLEGAFLAQHEINTQNLLPHGLQLRLLIDSSQEDNGKVAMAAQFIANRVVKAGNPDHIVAVVGWATSEETINARDILAAIHIPMVSQTASSVALSGSSPYFFRVDPPDNLQGNILGTVAVQQLHAKTVLVLQDPADSYSASLANAFSSYLKAHHTTVINASITEWVTTAEQYEQTMIPNARARQANLIFLAGSDIDGIRLAHALGESARANPTDVFLANLKILGGDALYTNLLLGRGDDPDAALAAKFPQDMQRLLFTSFAHPDEWTFLHVPQKQQPAFFTNWSNTYQHALPPANNAFNPGNDPILTYDAVRVIAKATTLVSGSLTGQVLRNALASLGHGTVPAFQGVSGRITFDAQGNPIEKAVVVLDIEKRNGQNMVVLHQIAGKFF